jgi:hypothetical protein
MNSKTLAVFVAIVAGAFVVSPALAAPLTQTAPIELTPAIIAGVVGAIVSLCASYLPKFRTWWAALEADVKQAVSFVAMVVVGVGLYVLACTPSLGFPYVACPVGGLWSLAAIVISALTANQVIDRVSPDLNDVKAVKAVKAAKKMTS